MDPVESWLCQRTGPEVTRIAGVSCPTGRRQERLEDQRKEGAAESQKREEGTSQKLEGESERGGSHHDEVRGRSS